MPLSIAVCMISSTESPAIAASAGACAASATSGWSASMSASSDCIRSFRACSDAATDGSAPAP
ncbi:MAG: hypothetical protein R2708_25825 [Vicinamibacterales bacterium]